MQISRLFEIVYILINRKRVTAKELADRFEVSIRTIYRDIDALALAGVPVYTSQGAGGGIHISDAYVLNKSALTDEEQNQILLALGSLSATGHYRADALLSRLGSLFDKGDSQWIEVDFTRWGNKESDQHTFAAIKDAILGQRMLTFVYFSSYGGRGPRKVSPVKLVYKNRSWYLQGFCHERQALRTFKISRMLAVQITDERFDREALPPVMPIDGPYEATEPAAPVDVTLRFQPEVAWRALDEFDPMSAEWNADGSLTIRAEALWDTWLFGFILSFGAAVEVAEPAILRKAILGELEKSIRRYREVDIQTSSSMGYTAAITKKQGGNTMEKMWCQSCAMPMETEQYGTNQDGSPNSDYCMYCFKDGAFTSDQTMEQMIDVCVPFMVEEGMAEAEARKVMNETLPQLKRWKKA